MGKHAPFRPFLTFKGLVVRHLEKEMHPAPQYYGAGQVPSSGSSPPQRGFHQPRPWS